jgi:uroporphyrinogen decarboxylase
MKPPLSVFTAGLLRFGSADTEVSTVEESKKGENMNSRERVLTALRHEQPDRTPVFAEFVRIIAARLAEELGCERHEVGLRLGNDMVLLKPLTVYPAAVTKEVDTFEDEWGIIWKKVGNYYERTNYPMITMDDIDEYDFPDPSAPFRYEGLQETIDTFKSDYAVFGNAVITIFERAWWLRGMEKFLEDMMVNKDYAHELLDRTMHFNLTGAKRLVSMGVDAVWFGDDVGMQSRMLISPELWREFLKPRYAKLIGEVKAINPDLYVAYHSDGYLTPIIDELIEIGVDILNPIQPLCMDPAEIKRRFGRNLSFWGTVDVQHTMPFGTPEDVEREVKLRIETVGKNGGLILAPAHHLQEDVHLENIHAFYRAAKRG